LKQSILFFYLLSLLTITLASYQNNPKGEIKVVISNLRNSKGQLCLSLYNAADGFPDNGSKAYHFACAPIQANKSEYTFANLPYGMYAIAIFHDENADKILNTNFLGIPKEGVAVSNNAKGFMGPPRFNDAKFQLNQPQQVLNLKMVYL